jgi:hypothetical protein
MDAQEEEPDLPPAKTDINLAIFFDPHPGQDIFFLRMKKKSRLQIFSYIFCI